MMGGIRVTLRAAYVCLPPSSASPFRFSSPSTRNPALRPLFVNYQPAQITGTRAVSTYRYLDSQKMPCSHSSLPETPNP